MSAKGKIRRASIRIYDDPRMVLVLWQDAQSHDDWNDRPESAEEIALPTQQTLGFLVAETVEMISVAGSFDPQNDNIAHRMDIPRGMIVRMYEVKVQRMMRNCF